MALKRDYQAGENIPGTVYQVVRTIGAGGMGTVYDVEDTTIGKRYVLKTLHPELGDRQDLARRMQNEARTLARLNHPNIVEVVTAGVTSDEMKLPYYVMERLNGQNLRVVLQKKGSLELPHAFHIAIDLLDALDHAHDKGVIHRDVKPDNIFLHKTIAGVTVTKLLDFGIMTLLDGGKGETGGRFLGTLRYAAPEQLKGEKPTPKMDLYAAALVVYEMIAGRGPFDDAGDQHRVAAARLHEGPPPLGRFVQVPPEVESLMRSALSIDPAARPRDAFSFAAHLRNFKRASSAHPGNLDSTENRPTVNAVLSHAAESPRPAVVKVRPGMAMTPLSPQAATPVAAAVVPATAATAAKTTMVGMAPPTMSGGTLQNAPPSGAGAASGGPPAAPASSIDRAAATRSLVIDTPRMPQNDTDMVGATAPIPPTAVSPVRADVPPTSTLRVPSLIASAPDAGGRVATAQSPQFVWPQERKESDRSDSAQVHSMSAAASAPSGRGRMVAIMAAAAFLGVAGLGAGAVLAWQSARRTTTTASSVAVTTAPVAPTPAPEPVSPAPAPSETGTASESATASASAPAPTGRPLAATAPPPSHAAPPAPAFPPPPPPATTPTARTTAAPTATIDKAVQVKSGI